MSDPTNIATGLPGDPDELDAYLKQLGLSEDATTRLARKKALNDATIARSYDVDTGPMRYGNGHVALNAAPLGAAVGRFFAGRSNKKVDAEAEANTAAGEAARAAIAGRMGNATPGQLAQIAASKDPTLQRLYSDTRADRKDASALDLHKAERGEDFDREDSRYSREAEARAALAKQKRDQELADREQEQGFRHSEGEASRRAQIEAAIASHDGKPKTEGDKKAQLLGLEMINAEQQLRGNGGADRAPDTGDVALDSSPLTRGATSDAYREQQAAAERWASNYLYLKSGAAAGAEETRKTVVQYTPQRGDSPTVIAQKRAARTQAMQGVGKVYGIDVPDFDAAPSAPNGGPPAQPTNNRIKKWDDL